MVTDLTLSSLINLFALFCSTSKLDAEKAKTLISIYLTRHFGIRNKEDYEGMFLDLLEVYSLSPKLDKEAIVSDICANLKGSISVTEAPSLLLRLMEFCSHSEAFDDNISIFSMMAKQLHISEKIVEEFYHYVRGENTKLVRLHTIEGLDGEIRTLYLKKYNLMVFTYVGFDVVFMNDVPVTQGMFQVWEQSGILKSLSGSPIYYSTVLAPYLEGKSKQKVTFSARDVQFRFPNSENGIHDLSFDLNSGELLAIMGGSGAGKTTMLTLLNGTLKPQSGSITINGHDISEPAAKELIGFVPQDDLLIEELTVYQNLWYTAKLCFAGMSDQELDARVMKVLTELGLDAAKDLKVGSAINKFISGGQRKRLNIALELIREPAVLFLDEPTSGLSSTDTERVIHLLKEQTYKGKLIVVNIHQPSSDVYKLFDRLWLLDRGGYPVFDGNPIEAITYFKGAANYADADTSMCPVCGNVNPEVVLNIIDQKAFDKSGHLSAKRKVSPQEWHQLYLDNRPEMDPVQEVAIPHSDQKKPGAFRQFLIQLERNVMTKITNRQYLFITLLVTPVLALICGFLTRYAPESGYTVMENKNLVSFLFMAIIVVIFVGMSGSAEEIIKDRALLKREKFLHLSYGSYISSKVVLLAFVSLLQTLCFVLVGQVMMSFYDMTWVWWLILFVSAFLANLTGLLLSQCLSSVVAIYITIPLLLIPQILLCGLVVDFSDLDGKSTTGNVPAIGNMIPSRWAFEAMAVTTFTNNAYEANFYEYDQLKYENQYYRGAVLWELQSQLETLEDERQKGKPMKPSHLQVISNELPVLASYAEVEPYKESLKFEEYDSAMYVSIKDYLSDIETLLQKRSNSNTLYADRVLTKMRDAMGGDAFRHLRESHVNRKLEDVVINYMAGETHTVVGGHIVPRMGFVYLTPRSKNGMAPFYSPVKCVGDLQIPTLWFNIGILALMGIVVLIMLYTDFPGRKLQKSEK
ncbi:MAG: ATP-binding cassette domain-containing protein [Bacteroidales bacterium]|nr:ATP-binding cassette domain-containing protein [Bacteroidales bacterium]